MSTYPFPKLSPLIPILGLTTHIILQPHSQGLTSRVLESPLLGCFAAVTIHLFRKLYWSHTECQEFLLVSLTLLKALPKIKRSIARDHEAPINPSHVFLLSRHTQQQADPHNWEKISVTFVQESGWVLVDSWPSTDLKLTFHHDEVRVWGLCQLPGLPNCQEGPLRIWFSSGTEFSSDVANCKFVCFNSE